MIHRKFIIPRFESENQNIIKQLKPEQKHKIS